MQFLFEELMQTNREHWYFIFNLQKFRRMFESIKKEIKYTSEPKKKTDYITILHKFKQEKKISNSI